MPRIEHRAGDGPPDGTPQPLGQRIRQMRLMHGLSARELARRAGVTPGYLSRVENGHISPTVQTLTRVMQAMDETVGALFGSPSSAGPVVRRTERRLVQHEGVEDRLITPTSSSRLEVLETTIQPGASSGEGDYRHPGDEEVILVLSGQLHVWLEGTRYELYDGDSITFPCQVPHRWTNPGTQTATVLWIITPGRY